MKSVQAVALILTVVVYIAAGPLPDSSHHARHKEQITDRNSTRTSFPRPEDPNPERSSSRHDDLKTADMQQNAEKNSTGPESRQDDKTKVTGLESHQDEKTNVTGLESHQDGKTNITSLESHQDEKTNVTGDAALNSTANTFMFVLPVEPREPNWDVPLIIRSDCILSTCLTANLGSALQRGDEKAGSATTDPFGVGKK